VAGAGRNAGLTTSWSADLLHERSSRPLIERSQGQRRFLALLDTNVAIDHLRGSPPAVDLLSDLIEAEEEVDALEQFFSALSWVPVGDEVAGLASAY
jgi:hypothetical protein